MKHFTCCSLKKSAYGLLSDALLAKIGSAGRSKFLEKELLDKYVVTVAWCQGNRRHWLILGDFITNAFRKLTGKLNLLVFSISAIV